MRQVITCAIIILIMSGSFSQQSNSKTLSQQDYLEKSKKQQTAGRILMVGGLGLFITGLVYPKGEPVSFFEYEIHTSKMA